MRKLYLAAIPATILGTSPILGWMTQSEANTEDKGASETPKLAPAKIGHPSLMSPHASPIVVNRNRVFVVNTPSDTVDVIDTKTRVFGVLPRPGLTSFSRKLTPETRRIAPGNHQLPTS